MSYQVPQHIDNNKVFIVNRSEIEKRLDPLYYGSDFTKFFKHPYSVRLKDVCINFSSGFGAGKNEQTTKDNGYIQIRPTNIDNDGFLKYEKIVYVPLHKGVPFVKKGTVLFNNTNSQEWVGKTALLQEDSKLYTSNHITSIIVNSSKVISEYLWIVLNIYQRNKVFYSICTNWNNQSGVGIDLLKSVKVPIPPISSQQEIVDYYISAYNEKQKREFEAKQLLDSIDAYILNELGITLPESKTDLGNRFFIVSRSTLDKRWDPYYSQVYFRDAFKAVESGKYPVSNLKSISELITSGITPKSGGEAYTEDRINGVPFIRSGNISIDGELNYDDLLYLRPIVHETVMSSSKLRMNDLLIAIVGATIGQVGIYLSNEEANINQAIALVRLKEGNNIQFFKELLKSSIGQLSLNRLKRPVARANINLEEIGTIKIVLPPLDKQNEIASHIFAIRQKAKALQEEGNAILEEAKRNVESMIIGK